MADNDKQQKEPHFEYTQEGYIKAKEFLVSNGHWEQVSTRGLSTDGYSVIHEANAIYKRMNNKHDD